MSFFVAEIGSNWKGDTPKRSYQNAMDSITQAAQAGANAVKFQLFRADTLYSAKRAPDTYRRVKDYELNADWLSDIAQRAHDLQVYLWLSVFDRDLIGRAVVHCDTLKIASGDLTNNALLHAACMACEEMDVQLAISTGAATAQEVEDALVVVSGYPKTRNDLTLMQCVSSYPAAPIEYNVSVIDWLDELNDGTNGHVGLSDHTEPGHVLTAQLALSWGASVFERHFRTEDAAPDNPDYAHSLTPVQFHDYIKAVAYADIICGTGEKTPAMSEVNERLGARRGPDGLRPAIFSWK